MATNMITVKEVQEKSRDGSSWLELTDQENRTHRIFRRVQDNEGNWHDLTAKYEMLRNSENRTLRLTTEQKGRFTNVVDVEPVENAATRPTPIAPLASTAPPARASKRVAEDRDAECRLKTFTTAYAKDLAVAGKISMDDILGWSELLYRYLQGEVTVSDDEVSDVIRKAKAIEGEPAAKTTRRPTMAKTVEGAVR